jgi:hypothetical protein
VCDKYGGQHKGLSKDDLLVSLLPSAAFQLLLRLLRPFLFLMTPTLIVQIECVVAGHMIRDDLGM